MPETVKLDEPVQTVDVKVASGLGTYFGIAASVAAAVGAVIAAIEENDVATAGASAAAVVAIFETLSGRFAQAVAKIRVGAEKAGPWVDEAQSRMAAAKAQGSTLHRPE